MDQTGFVRFVVATSLVLPVVLPVALARAEQGLSPDCPPGPGRQCEDPRVAGPGGAEPDLPPVGRSLFDLLFTTDGPEGRVYDVPFPFTRVINRIKDQLPADDLSGYSSLKTVLIPIGRSLQRNDAAPDLFRFPRIVVAVDTESRGPLFLKDRLFLGYQQKSKRIEVISYNEAAGRFEFQIVKDYAPSRRPKVRYAKRAICTSCHQNSAPIFARAPWSETNFNPTIRNRLLQHGTHYHEVPVEDPGGAAGFIDQATDRANRFSTYQLLWREGCAAGAEPSRARRCRAGALVAMLQLRLSAFSRYDDQADLYRDHFVPVLTKQWQQRWPEGLLISSADIPDHNPSVEAISAEVPARYDPLTLRPRLTRWSLRGQFNRVIAGLSKFLPGHDIARLDDHLFKVSVQNQAQHEDFSGPCELSHQAARTGGRLVNFECQLAGDVSNGVFDLAGEVVFGPDWQVSPIINWLTLAGKDGIASLTLSGGPIEAGRDHSSVELDVFRKDTGLHARLPNGNALAALRLTWSNPAADYLPFPRHSAATGNATLTVKQDFSRVHEAIAAILSQSDLGRYDLLSGTAFHGAKAMAMIFSELGLGANDYCCDMNNMPPAQVDGMDDVDHVGLEGDDALKTFHRYCGICHQADTARPPGFLFGDNKAQVSAKLKQCAPRILYRLQMWQLDEKQSKSPMPPAKRLQALKYPADDWRHSPELLRMKHYIGGLLADRSGQRRAARGVLNTPYADLPPCLP